MTTQAQKEKDDSESVMEKRLQEEKRCRQSLESQLANEKKCREAQDLQISDLKKNNNINNNNVSNGNGGHHHLHNNISVISSKSQKSVGDLFQCKAEQCVKRISQIEMENKKICEEMRKKHDRVMMLECEIKSLNRTRDTESRVDTLMVALNLMEDKNASLQESLSAETRFKLDLFSALGEARRQLESVNCKWRNCIFQKKSVPL